MRRRAAIADAPQRRDDTAERNGSSLEDRFRWSAIRRGITQTAAGAVLAFFLLYTLLPMLWLLISSLKTNLELFREPFRLPLHLQWVNYGNAIRVSGLAILFANSLLISAAATAGNILIAAMAAYVIARYPSRRMEGIHSLLVAGILVPLTALMVPYFTLIKALGIYDTKWALILTYTAIGLPVSVFIIRGFMNSIAKEIEEAAVIDGCNFYALFFRIIFPLSRPGIVTALTFEFLTCWNEFVYAMLLTSSLSTRTIQIGIRYFKNQFTTDYTSMYAAVVLSIIPSILAYILFQNQIISGLTQGAVKE